VPWGCFFHADGRDLVADAEPSTACANQRAVFRGVNTTGLEFGAFFNHPYPGVHGVTYVSPRAADLQVLGELGFNVIRLPFEWARLITGWRPGDPLPDALDAAYLARIDEVIVLAAARQLYVVLDMHDFLKYWSGPSAQACVDGSADHQVLLARTWRLLARHFADSRTVLGYDLMNEPVRSGGAEACGSHNWHQIAQELLTAIRSVDANHLIIVEGPNYSLASRWPTENPVPFVTDSLSPGRVVYSPHVYFDAGDDSIPDPDETDGPLPRWTYYLRDRLVAIVDWSQAHDVPVFIGETGVPPSSRWAEVVAFAFRAFLEPEKVSVTAWQYVDPAWCPPADPGCLLNLAHPDALSVRNALRAFPGGTYDSRDSIRGDDGRLISSPAYSRLYDDVLVNPWHDASSSVTPDFRCTDPAEPGFGICVSFDAPYANFKLSHATGIDTRRFRSLRFSVRLTGTGRQNFKFYTTAPRSDSDPGPEPAFPDYDRRPELRNFAGDNPAPDTWIPIEIPLGPIVDPANPIIKGIAFQNLDSAQPPFHIDDVSLTPFADDIVRPSLTPIRAVHIRDLRRHTDALRIRFDLAPFRWSDPALTPGTPVRAQHLLDLREAVSEVRSFDFPDAIAPGVTARAAHITELRAAIFSIE
jgi:endoglucanase